MLEAYGIPCPAERTATTRAAAVKAAGELGYPVAVKTARPGVHKTELGAIALGLTEPARVRDEVARIGTPVIVQRMADPGVELLLGAVRDPTFGPVVAVGLGGVMAELVKDVRFALPPISEPEARALVTDGTAGKLLAGFRGAAPADVHGAVDIVIRIDPARRGRPRARGARPESGHLRHGRLPGCGRAAQAQHGAGAARPGEDMVKTDAGARGAERRSARAPAAMKPGG